MLSIFVNMTCFNNAEENISLSQNKNFIELLKNLILKNDIDIINNIISIVFNILCDSEIFLNTFLRDEFFDVFIFQLINILKSPRNIKVKGINGENSFILNDNNVIKNFLSLSELIVKSNSQDELLNKIEKILEVTCEIFNIQIKSIENDCLWVFYFFSKNYAEKNHNQNSLYNYDSIIQTFINKQVFAKLLAIDYSRDKLILENILNFFLNITNNNPGIVYHLLEIQILDYLEVPLSDKKVNLTIEKLILGFLTNIADSTDTNKHEIASSKLLEKIFERFNNNIVKYMTYLKYQMVRLIKILAQNCKFAIGSSLVKIKILEVIIKLLDESYLSIELMNDTLISLKSIFFSALPLKDFRWCGVRPNCSMAARCLAVP